MRGKVDDNARACDPIHVQRICVVVGLGAALLSGSSARNAHADAGDAPLGGWPLAAPALDAGRPAVRSSGLPPLGIGSKEPELARDTSWLLELTAPDLPVRWDPRVLRYLEFYRWDPRGRAAVARWFKKSGRYSGAIRRALRERGLPEELIWVALVESGFEPAIRSPAGAAGLWQLMPEGARAYGLTVDRFVDERLDPERSTEAAARYLADLYRRFGVWELALAAYNMGDGGLLTAIRKYNTNDYWELSSIESGCPYETALYVPKIIAVTVVAHNPMAFGIDSVQLDPAIEFDSVMVPPNTSLKTIATAARVEARTVEEYNPQLRAGRTPPAAAQEGASFRVRVPLGKGALVSEMLAKSGATGRKLAPPGAAENGASGAQRMALPRSGAEPVDSSALSDTAGADAPQWPPSPWLADVAGQAAWWQSVRARPAAGSEFDVARVAPADPSRGVFRRADASLRPSDGAPADDRPVAVVQAQNFRLPGRQRIFYRVAAGDKLAGIAARLHVSEDELCRVSPLDPAARLYEGMMLQAFVPEGLDLPGVAYLREKDVRILVAGSDEFFDHFEALRGRKRTTIVVQQGDTWEKLARRFNLTVGQLERINQRSRLEKLVPKQTLVIYAPVDRTRVQAPKLAAVAAPPAREAIVAPRPEDLPPLPEASGAAGPSASSR